MQADGTGVELFDLATDANETKDLSQTQPEVVKQLSTQALAWRKSLP